jgi:hypothetical protein
MLLNSGVQLERDIQALPRGEIPASVAIMGNGKITGSLALFGALLFWIFKEAISNLVGDLAEKVINPALLKRGVGSVILSPIDFVILTLLLIGVLALFWPWLTRWSQRDIVSNAVRTKRNGRVTFTDVQLHNDRDLRLVARATSPVLVDCTIAARRLGLIGTSMTGFYLVQARRVSIIPAGKIEQVASHVPLLEDSVMVNININVDHLFVDQNQLNALPTLTSKLVPIDSQLLLAKQSLFGRLRLRAGTARGTPP